MGVQGRLEGRRQVSSQHVLGVQVSATCMHYLLGVSATAAANVPPPPKQQHQHHQPTASLI